MTGAKRTRAGRRALPVAIHLARGHLQGGPARPDRRRVGEIRRRSRGRRRPTCANPARHLGVRRARPRAVLRRRSRRRRAPTLQTATALPTALHRRRVTPSIARLSPDGAPIAAVPLGIRTSMAPTTCASWRPSPARRSRRTRLWSWLGRHPCQRPRFALGATVTDHTVVMTWTAPANAAVAPVATYVIEAGTTPGATDLANFATGSAATSFLTPPVPNGSYPNGSYYVRVRARDASGTGPPTPDLRVVVGPSPPGPPVLTGSVGSDRTVFLAWTWPVTGAAVTGYRLEAGTAPGLSNAAVRLLPSTARSFGAAGVTARAPITSESWPRVRSDWASSPRKSPSSCRRPCGIELVGRDGLPSAWNTGSRPAPTLAPPTMVMGSDTP